MELLQAHDHYIVVDGEQSLWCSRFDGHLQAKRSSDISMHAWNPVCLGLIHGVIGKIQIPPDNQSYLLVVRKKSFVGQLLGKHKIYKVSKIAILPLSVSDTPDLEIDMCTNHHFGISAAEKDRAPPMEASQQQQDSQQKALQRTWNQLKSAGKTAAEIVASTTTNKLERLPGMPSKKVPKEFKDKEKFERRILEEIFKMFDDSDSFYMCNTYDLTSSSQRQSSVRSSRDECPQPLGASVDSNYFWNKRMLKDVIASKAHHWVVPIIKGFVQVQKCVLDFSNSGSQDSVAAAEPLAFTITVISRRSRHRAGTRYKRRGVDEKGNVANFVETEQIVEAVGPHFVSFVQVRGSVPIFWSQPGIKYRPPPRYYQIIHVRLEAEIVFFLFID